LYAVRRDRARPARRKTVRQSRLDARGARFTV
jgi:hypothetical protein